MPPLRATLLALCALVAASGSRASDERGATKAYRRPEYLAIKKDLLRGWGTWDSPDPLAQVHLPDGLSVSLVFRQIDSHAYLSKPQMVTDKKDAQFRPGAHALDGSYSEAEVGWKGTRVRVQSAADGDDLVLLLTRLEDAGKPIEVLMNAGMLWGRRGTVSREGQELVASLPGRYVRISSTGRQIDGSGAASLDLEMKGVVGVSTGRPRTVEQIEAILAAKRDALQAEAAGHGELADAYGAIRAAIGWSTIYDPEYNRIVTVVSREWNKWFKGYVVFGWDNFFIPYACSLFNRELAYANFAEHMRSMTPGGFIPNVEETGGKSSWDRSQPPVGSLMLKEIYKRYGDRWILESSFGDLLSWNRWWIKDRMNGKLLSWGSDLTGNPMKEKEAHTAVGAAWESGMDDSPMFEGVPYNPRTNMFEMQDVGLNALYIADCRALAEIADVLGRRAEASELRLRAEQFSKAIEALWDSTSGLYLNRRTDTGDFSGRMTPTLFYPLIARVPAVGRAAEMVDQHLMNPTEFGGKFVIPSISRDDPAYPTQHYWKGAVWPPLNFLVYLGLRNYDLPQPRRELARKSMAMFLGEWNRKGFISENYSALDGTGDDPHLTSTPFYTWGVLMGMMSFIEAGQMPAPEASISKHSGR